MNNESIYTFRNNESQASVDEILLCPSKFILFNKICYYVYSSFVYGIRSGERLCYNQYSKSTLVKFDTHQWGNVNVTRFLGRAFDDALMEFFYYSLEKELVAESRYKNNGKHWLRLLIGDKNDPRECFLRYFARSSGAFTVFRGCNNGGHPVCQCEPTRFATAKIITASKTMSNVTSSKMENKIQSITTSLMQRTTLNSTHVSILFNKTVVSSCEDCTTISVADEDLVNNETEIGCKFNNETEIGCKFNNDLWIKVVDKQPKEEHSRYRTLIIILTGPVLALILLFVSTGLFVRHYRQRRTSYLITRNVGDHRTKRSSITRTTSDLRNTLPIPYTHLKSSENALTETDMLLSFNNSILNDNNIELLPATKVRITTDENKVDNDDQELLYSVLE